jgi:uncharacterized protein (DUF58 family)
MPYRRNSIYALLIFCLLAGLFTGRGVFFNISYLLGGLMLLTLLWSWVAINWVQITRQTRTRRAQVGKTLDESFVVKNNGIIPKVWLEVRDHSDVPGHHASFVVPTLRPFGSYRWAAGTVCSVRGEYTLGPMTLISGDPFGLFQATRHISATSKILVYPPTLPLAQFATPMGLLSGGDAQRQRTHFVTTNAAGVREYAPGDGFNRIHWKSTARKDQMLVKEFELDPLADIWVFLDLSAASQVARPYTPDGGEGEMFIPPSSGEYGIVVASSLVQYFLVKERALGFVTYNPARCVFQPDRGNRQLTRILEALAMARFESQFTCEQLMALEGHHLSRGTTLIVISADPTDGWLREVNLLTRRGLRVIAVALDPVSFGATGVRSGEETRTRLEGMGALTYLVRQGDDLSAVLGQRRQ